MSKIEDDNLKRAQEYWQNNQPVEAGRLIHDNLRPEDRPAWAANILKLLLDRTDVDRSQFESILCTASQPQLWVNGHRCFDQLRRETLKYDALRNKGKLTKEQETFAWLLSLAEFVAKVTYNVANPPDEFDEDSGWWIAVSLRGFVNAWQDDEFSKIAWKALCFEASR